MTVPTSSFLRSLQRALATDLQRELDLTLRVSVLRGRGYRSIHSIAGELDVTPAEARLALERLDRVTPSVSEVAPPAGEAGGQDANAPRRSPVSCLGRGDRTGTAAASVPESRPDPPG